MRRRRGKEEQRERRRSGDRNTRAGEAQYNSAIIIRVVSAITSLINEEEEVQQYCYYWYSLHAKIQASKTPKLNLITSLRHNQATMTTSNIGPGSPTSMRPSSAWSNPPTLSVLLLPILTALPPAPLLLLFLSVSLFMYCSCV